MFKKIAVALDGSKCADEALDVAINLAQNEAAELFVCSIVDPRALAAVTPLPAIEPVIAAGEIEARQLVQAAVEKALHAGVFAEGETHFGSSFQEIVRFAKRRTVDAIVMGTHGRSGLKRLLLGSVAENVLRNASCPVIVVREGSSKTVAA